MLAAAALVTSFLGGEALRTNPHPGTPAIVAIVAFVLVAACAVVILLPWKFLWSFDPNELITDYVDDRPQMTTHLALRDLALHHASSREKNEGRIACMQWIFRVATVLLAVEVVAWLLALPGRII